jgi:hypothetical protein
MKKVLVGLILALTLGTAVPAQAVPRYGYRFTASHGYIVWNRNDYQGPVRARCHWNAGGSRWTTNWILSNGEFEWTTSDAGNWGNARPRNLACSYVRL